MKRNVALCVFLTIITCGLYALYWIYVLNEDINTESDHRGDMSGIIYILLALLTCNIVMYVWYYQMGVKCDEVREKRGEYAQNSGILFLLLGIFVPFGAVINYALMQSKINSWVDADLE